MRSDEKAEHISKCLQLAILLEVSVDKPGNVNLRVLRGQHARISLLLLLLQVHLSKKQLNMEFWFRRASWKLAK